MILIDTTPIVAICDPRDGLHSHANSAFENLAHESLVICEPVLAEAALLLRPHPLRVRLQRFLHDFAIAPLQPADTYEFWQEVFRWLEKYSDHMPDWADAYIATLCGRNPVLQLWTYDSEFKTIWRRPDGSKIPLAEKL